MGFDEDQFFFSAQWDFSFRYFFKWANPGFFFVSFRSFQKQIFQKILYISFSGIRTRIVEVEGEHADHLTTPRPSFRYC